MVVAANPAVSQQFLTTVSIIFPSCYRRRTARRMAPKVSAKSLQVTVCGRLFAFAARLDVEFGLLLQGVLTKYGAGSAHTVFISGNRYMNLHLMIAGCCWRLAVA